MSISSKVKEKPAKGGFLARLEAASNLREKIYVVFSEGLCIEFRAPKDDGEHDRIANEAKAWAEKRANKTAPAIFINSGPKSAHRFGMCHVAATLMVAGYDGYEIGDDGEIKPIGDSFDPLTFEEWLKYAKDHWSEFDKIMSVADREAVKASQLKRGEMFADEGKD